MSLNPPPHRSGANGSFRPQTGLTLLELMVTTGLMAALVGSMSILVGVAIRSKLVVAVRSADTETARQTLEWMSERLRNAGLNLKPSEQVELRCKDMVVAQDAALRPTANSIHVSGEIVNTDTIAANEVTTVGYRLGNDPGTGVQIVMEYRRPCSGGGETITPLSNPRVTVTNLSFDYFSGAGVRITNLTDAGQIRLIRIIRISLTVQGAEGSSGVQIQTWTRDVMLRNPEPNVNDWKNLNESY
ncbi:MAG: PulJ/GspJ family protein [bacterium]